MGLTTIDITGAYLQIEYDEYVTMIFKLEMSYLLVNIKPSIYMKYVMIDKGVKGICMRFQNNLYNCFCR